MSRYYEGINVKEELEEIFLGEFVGKLVGAALGATQRALSLKRGIQRQHKVNATKKCRERFQGNPQGFANCMGVVKQKFS